MRREGLGGGIAMRLHVHRCSEQARAAVGGHSDCFVKRERKRHAKGCGDGDMPRGDVGMGESAGDAARAQLDKIAETDTKIGERLLIQQH